MLPMVPVLAYKRRKEPVCEPLGMEDLLPSIAYRMELELP
jgi:hypothetical protein